MVWNGAGPRVITWTAPARAAPGRDGARVVVHGWCSTLAAGALALLLATGCNGGGSPAGAALLCDCTPGQSCVSGRCVTPSGPGAPGPASPGDGGTATGTGGTGGAGSDGGTAGGAPADAGPGAGAQDGGSGAGLACALPPPSASAAQAPTQVIALGPRQVGSVVTFTVPAGAASVTFVEQARSASATVDLAGGPAGLPNGALPLRVTDARGQVIYDDLAAPVGSPEQQLVYAGSPAAVMGTLTLPDSSAGLTLVAGGLAGGTWSAVVSDFAYECSLASGCTPASARRDGVYDVTVLVKPGSGAGAIPAAGRVDVTFNLTPGQVTPPLSAAAAPTDPDLQRVLRTLGTVLARVGLSLGTVTFVDVPAALADRVASGVNLDDGSPCGDLGQLLASGAPGRQINVFLVSNFTSSDTPPNAVVGGVDGTIPGPATISPGVNAGTAVGVADLRHGSGSAACRGGLSLACGADQVALVTAHEMGHFLGLYHVTEQEGGLFDPLSDTATCACRTCAASPSQCAGASPPPASPHPMAVAECTRSTACGGGDNLMFWLLDQGQTGALTPQQGSVMRSSPAVY